MAVCKFSLAVSEKKGEQFESIWFDVVLFKDLAERKQPLIKKGSRVFIDGKFSVNEWTDKNGNKQKRFNVIAFTCEVCERPAKVDPASSFVKPQFVSEKPVEPIFTEEDIPF